MSHWCWGYELGINEHDVVIGNEAVFTKPWKEALNATDRGEPLEKGILGMEYVRLGLERAKTAEEAVDVISSLLEEYGQFGSAVAGADVEDGAYDNSYLIADTDEAWILETAGRRWAAKQISTGSDSISNELSIRHSWTKGSDDLIANAISHDWWPEEREPFDFADAYTDHETALQVSRIRYRRSQQLLDRFTDDDDFDIGSMQRILRDHYEETFLDGPKFNAALPDFLTICMHSSPAKFTWGDSVSSAIFELPANNTDFTKMWWTPGPPCIGVYVPFYIESGTVPAVVSNAGTATREIVHPTKVAEDEAEDGSYWWEFKQFLESIKGDDYGRDFKMNQKIVRSRFDELESKFRHQAINREEKARELYDEGRTEAGREVLASFTEACVSEVRGEIDRLLQILPR
ncbi:C69 family dipeptidase [Halegenticoccus tardaugens]|uniref:C69 family dipeptidase n=1 Tax=Halegenticoccus tardaugens TaxID=2071624 RepID=UPI00100BF9A8|nr:C69 family dipeptidase [Halegenticoccus tardaugens]